MESLYASITDALSTADIYATYNLPGQVVPPMALVYDSVPFIQELTETGNFAERYSVNFEERYSVNFEVILIPEKSDGEGELSAVLEMIETACVALGDFDFEVTQIGDFEYGGTAYLAARLQIKTITALGGN